jgi:hypothetical protein
MQRPLFLLEFTPVTPGRFSEGFAKRCAHVLGMLKASLLGDRIDRQIGLL